MHALHAGVAAKLARLRHKHAARVGCVMNGDASPCHTMVLAVINMQSSNLQARRFEICVDLLAQPWKHMTRAF